MRKNKMKPKREYKTISVIITKPEPYCPDCGAIMVLRRPRPGSMKFQHPFWGCNRYPDCYGTREIDPETGKPEDD
jgi:ssDNA-binding Zn-finger/Zn-ribbon topoisomerase 1